MIGNPGRVLVTGATGFIGKYVMRALSDAGWAIDAMARVSSDQDAPGVRWVTGDLDQPASFESLVVGCDSVVHLGAFIPPNFADSAFAEACIRRNGIATLRLAEAAASAGVRRFVYVTSGNVFAPEETNPGENGRLYPVARATYYLASKVLGEIYVEHVRATRNLGALTLRITSTYGHGMPETTVVGRFMALASRGACLEVRDGGVPTYDLLYVGDVARVITAALEHGEAGVYNLGGGRAYRVAELAQAVSATYPERDVRIATAPLVGAPATSFPALRIDKAQAAWGFIPTPLGQGLGAMRRAAESPETARGK